jgi:chloramphenicol 3-O-phosphotransferase
MLLAALMQRLSKILIAIMLVGFSVGAAAQIAQSTAMELKMSLASDNDTASTVDRDCRHCPMESDGDAATCMTGCVFHAVGLSSDILWLAKEERRQTLRPQFMRTLVGWQSPPEPDPPRTVV